MALDLSTTTPVADITDEPISREVGPRTTVDDLLAPARTGTVRTERSRRTREALITAVRDELRETGSFTADAVAERANCSPATFYSHFATKDDALALAFELTLGELGELVETTFTINTLSTTGLNATMTAWIEQQVTFFRNESLVFRAALARLPFHRGIRHAYRETERLALHHVRDVVAAGQDARLVRDGDSDEIAEALLVLSQGLNNPHVLRPAAEPVLPHIHRALVAALEPRRTRP